MPSLTPPPLPQRSGPPYQSLASSPRAPVVAPASTTSAVAIVSPRGGGATSGAAGAALEAVLAEAVGLLQQTGRAVAALDDAYNAAYNASSAADGWGGQGHDAADLGEVRARCGACPTGA